VVHLTTVPISLAYLVGHLRHQVQAGYRVHVISSPGPELERFCAESGAEAHRVEISRPLDPLRDVLALGRIVGVLRRLRPDIVHAHTPKAGLLGMIAARLVNVPVRIYHCHGLRYETARGPMRHLLRATEKTACRLASQVLTVSASLKAIMLEEGLCSAPKLHVPLHGSIGGVEAETRFVPATPAARAAVRRSLGIPAAAPVLGFVGRLVRDKGIVELFEAWRALRARMEDLHWLVVGPFEANDPVPEEVASAMRSDPRVHLVGLDWDTPRLFSAMDVLALPSYREGFPVVVLEAAAMGLPVVASRATGCCDAVTDGVTGTLVALRAVDELEAALARYLDGDLLRRAHGEAARARVLREYRPHELHRAVQDIYDAALASARGA
jgi:glycosyltransferase involved in cell wall biosynthesis